MGAAKRRGPREIRVQEGIEKEKQRQIDYANDRLERERNMTPEERRSLNNGRRMLGVMTALAASTLNY